jgi:sterol desaturase/sphingolipid hydroxylase (fatty acid hydroxylase superfamily)
MSSFAADGNNGLFARAAAVRTLPGAVAGAFVAAVVGAFHNPATRGTAIAVALTLPIVALTLPALWHMLLSPGSTFSAVSLAAAFVIAAATIALRRRARGRRFSFRVLCRAIFPRWLVRSESTRADLGFCLLNTMTTGTLIGWAALSFPTVAHWANTALVAGLGPQPAPWVGPVGAATIETLAMFLAYELAYWLDHYLSHRIPFLWEFHRVHHTAETLSPFTVFRVHPIDSLVFYNIMILVMAPTSAMVEFLLGTGGHELQLGGANIIILAYMLSTYHLQHSHMWIAFTGKLGRVLASPAHHQIHHSTDPAHFGQNLGAGLALFDWLFGTLRIPQQRNEHLIFGVEPSQHAPHTIAGGLITPFVRAFGTIVGPRRTVAAPGGVGVPTWQAPGHDIPA